MCVFLAHVSKQNVLLKGESNTYALSVYSNSNILEVLCRVVKAFSFKCVSVLLGISLKFLMENVNEYVDNPKHCTKHAKGPF